jgi:cell division septal protein FtsQ
MSGGFESAALSGARLGAGGGRVLDFRRRQAPPRRRKRSLWLALARPLGTALALIALPGGLIAWVLTSSRFSLHELAVEGTHRVAAEHVRRSLAPLRGENLVRLPLARVEALLATQPWIESVEIEKILPDRVRVSVRERRPVALLAGPGGTLSWADAKGYPIAPAIPGENREGFLVVDLAGAAPAAPAALAKALEAAAELKKVNPDWASSLTRVDVLGDEDLRLHLKDLPFPLLVRRADLVSKVHRFEALLPELGRRYTALQAVDLRFARRIIIQPSVQPAIQPSIQPAATAQKPFTNGGAG